MGASAIFEIATPYTSAELREIDYDQSADIVLVTHIDHPVQRLARFGHAQWLIGGAEFGTTTVAPTGVAATPSYTVTGTPVTDNYVVTAIDTITGRESLASSSDGALNDLSLDGNYNTVTWTAVAGADRYNVYRDMNGIYGYVGGSAGLTFRDDNIIPDLSTTPPGDRDPFAAVGDYPARITFHDQRAFFGRTLNKPNGIFSSQSADFLNMNASRPARASDAITLGLNARQVNTIQHLVPMKVLVALTDTAIFSISGSDGYLTPTNPKASPEGYRGASNVRPVLIDDICMFATSKGSAVRTIGYQFDRDGYRGNDITVFAPHLFQGFTLVAMAWAEHPTSTLWAVRSDGKALALTWQAEQDVWGWSLCETDGLFEDVCVITEDGIDRAYFIVNRTIDATPARYIERLSSPLWASIADANYLDCSARYTFDAPTSTVTGLAHLEGRTVSVLGDGAVFPDSVVTGGQITLPSPVTKAIVGLPYEAWAHTLPGIAQDNSGTTAAKRSQAGEVTLSVVKTRGIEVAPGRVLLDGEAETTDNHAAGPFYEVKTRNVEPYGSPPSLITGKVAAQLPPTDWQGQATVVIRQRYPLPMCVTGVVLESENAG